MIVYDSGRIIFSGIKSRAIINKRLNGASRLSGAQISPVKLVFCTSAAYDGDYIVGLIVHYDGGSLEGKFAVLLKFRKGRENLVKLYLNKILDILVQRGVDLITALRMESFFSL